MTEFLPQSRLDCFMTGVTIGMVLSMLFVVAVTVFLSYCIRKSTNPPESVTLAHVFLGMFSDFYKVVAQRIKKHGETSYLYESEQIPYWFR